MSEIERTPNAALFTHTTTIRVHSGLVGTRVMLADINLFIIGSLYMYSDDDHFYSPRESDEPFANAL